MAKIIPFELIKETYCGYKKFGQDYGFCKDDLTSSHIVKIDNFIKSLNPYVKATIKKVYKISKIS